MANDVFDLVVIGTGPGGYVCAIRAVQLGLKVAVVEKRNEHGGTCLNVGCIPSKAMLHASELLEEATHKFSGFGIKTQAVELDLDTMQKHRLATIAANVKGISFLLKKNNITVFHGVGRILDSGSVSVERESGEVVVIKATSIVIATGSAVASVPGLEIDGRKIISSTEALELESVPNRLAVIGAGVIGLELGSVWRRLGAQVTVVEYLDRVLPGMDSEIASSACSLLQKQGMEFHLGTKVNGIRYSDNAVVVELSGSNSSGELLADVVLVAVGRVPYTKGLGLEDVGVAMDDRARISVDSAYRTNVKGVYAIGDVIHGPMLAHKASDEGVAVAEIIAGKSGHVNYGVIPSVVYTSPEIAMVGKTEDEVQDSGVSYRVGKFPFAANARAKSVRHPEGFVKVISDASDGSVLGVHIIGALAGEMIHEAAVLMEFGGSVEDLSLVCHAHPTLSEAVREAALAVENRAIHV